MPKRALAIALTALFQAILAAVIRKLTRGPEPNEHPAPETFEAAAYGRSHLDGAHLKR